MKHTKMEKVRYPGTNNCPSQVVGSMWFPEGDVKCTGVGVCEDKTCPCADGRFVDFDERDVDDLIQGLKRWKEMPTDDYKEDEEYAVWLQKYEDMETKWWYKTWDWLTNFTFVFRPFQWGLKCKFSRTLNLFFSIPSTRSRGLQFGPFQITTPNFTKEK